MSEQLAVQVVVGTTEQLRAGRGETALTAVQAAAVLGISVSGFRILLDEGVVKPCAKFAKATLFKESDVEKLLARR